LGFSPTARDVAPLYRQERESFPGRSFAQPHSRQSPRRRVLAVRRSLVGEGLAHQLMHLTPLPLAQVR
jgi:hypothetical protein